MPELVIAVRPFPLTTAWFSACQWRSAWWRSRMPRGSTSRCSG